MKHLLLTITLAVLLFSCCKKKDESPQLPAITQEGKNTFGCKVDGSIITATGKPINWNDDEYVDYRRGGGVIGVVTIIKAQNPSPKWDLRIEFNATDYETGLFIIKTSNYNQASYFDLHSNDAPLGGNSYYTNRKDTGIVNIMRNDTKVIAGTFEMTVANDSGKIVHITDGRFDITK